MKNIILSTAILTAAQTSYAVTVNEVGDFDNDGLTRFDIGALDLGSNTISGQLSHTCVSDNAGSFACADQDLLSFDLGAGLQLDSIALSGGNLMFTTNSPTPPVPVIPPDANATIAGQSVTIDLFNTDNTLIFDPILGAGSYDLDIAAIAIYIGSVAETLSVDYTVTLNTSATTTVPLPAAAWMFGAALAGLGAIKRRV